MSRLLRTIAALLATASGTVVLAPTELPSSPVLAGPSALATEMASFGLRVVAAGLCLYLTVVLLALVLVELRVLPRTARRLVERWTGGGLAGAVRHAVGASVLAAGLLPLAPTAAHAAEGPPPVLAPVDGPDSPPRMAPMDEPPPTTVAPPPTTARPPTGPPPRMTPVDVPDPRPGARPPVRPPTAPPRTTPTGNPPPRPQIELPAEHPSRPTPAPRRSSQTLVVQPGDSFWTITEELVALRLGRAPTDKEVIGPWLDLIARNAHVLADPDDPDLLHPGAVLHLPPSPPR